jgi:hypothetical protein
MLTFFLGRHERSNMSDGVESCFEGQDYTRTVAEDGTEVYDVGNGVTIEFEPPRPTPSTSKHQDSASGRKRKR